MNRPARAIGTAAVALVLLAPAAAQAASPEKATVTPTAPEASWTGTSSAFVTNYVRFFGGTETVGCERALGCDVFTLTVEEGGKLEIEVTEDDGTGYVDLTVRQPDGQVFETVGEADVSSTFARSKAPAGTYTIEVQNDDLMAPLGNDGAYTGEVLLNDGKLPVAPAPEPTPEP